MSVKEKLQQAADWLDDRSGYRATLKVALEEPVPGGASFAYVFGSVLLFLLGLQMVTGIFLAMYYSPSASDAWASVAYIQDQVTLGWFVRGLHSHGASAMVIVAGLHMLQTAVYGAYKKPRELNWIVGVLMLGLILAFALTGYLLPWDQTGYWATKVATGIAGTSPVIGPELQAALQGGNEYGNLTLTRFFAIHVFILPGALILLTVLHVALFRRHGVTPHWWLSKKQQRERVQPFWPDQIFRESIVLAVIFAILVGVNFKTGGAHLDAPADPASNFDARPEWYFRPLFQALKYFHGIWEQVVALGLPVIIGGVLLALPFLDRGESRNPRHRIPYLAPLAVIGIVAGLLTWVSFAEDAGDDDLQTRLAESKEYSERARERAVAEGVPVTGALALLDEGDADDPVSRGRKRWQAECAGCHEGEERTGPEITYGYNSRAWIRGFLLDPGGDLYYGVTGIGSMEPVELEGADLDAMVEFLYAESGAKAKPELVARGRALYEEGDCTGCHPALDYKLEAEGGPNLARRGTVEMLAEFIGRPSHPRWFGDDNEMPEFYDQYNRVEREDIAAYLIWLRTAKPPE